MIAVESSMPWLRNAETTRPTLSSISSIIAPIGALVPADGAPRWAKRLSNAYRLQRATARGSTASG